VTEECGLSVNKRGKGAGWAWRDSLRAVGAAEQALIQASARARQLVSRAMARLAVVRGKKCGPRSARLRVTAEETAGGGLGCARRSRRPCRRVRGKGVHAHVSPGRGMARWSWTEVAAQGKGEPRKGRLSTGKEGQKLTGGEAQAFTGSESRAAKMRGNWMHCRRFFSPFFVVVVEPSRGRRHCQPPGGLLRRPSSCP
jgi:hypothetical protein